jgi:Cu+-exporting ATPase
MFIAAGMFLVASNAFADDATPSKPVATTKATYAVSGLHCPPCARTVESSLKKLKGVRSAKVDWTSKSAKVEFDESVLSAQQLALSLAATPHMMGGGMSYGGWLALSVPGIKDKASAKEAESAVRSIKGVANVSTSTAQHTLSVQFAKQGSVGSQQLIDELEKAGYKASNY